MVEFGLDLQGRWPLHLSDFELTKENIIVHKILLYEMRYNFCLIPIALVGSQMIFFTALLAMSYFPWDVLLVATKQPNRVIPLDHKWQQKLEKQGIKVAEWKGQLFPAYLVCVELFKTCDFKLRSSTFM